MTFNTVGRYICISPTTKSNGFVVPIAHSRFPSITFLISCRSRANLRLAGGPFPLCLHLRHYDVTRKCRATCYRIPESTAAGQTFDSLAKSETAGRLRVGEPLCERNARPVPVIYRISFYMTKEYQISKHICIF